MESANSHHQLQLDQLVGSSSSSSSSSLHSINPSVYGLGFTSTHDSWPPLFLNSNNWLSSSYPIERKQQENPTSQLLYGSSSGNSMATESQEESRIKEELAEHYYRKYSEILCSSSTSPSPANDDYLHHQAAAAGGNDVATRLFLMNNSSTNTNILLPDTFYSNSRSLPHLFPDPTAAEALDMNLEALDVLASSRFSGIGNLLGSSQNQIGIFRDVAFSNNAVDHHIPFYASNKVSSGSSNVVSEPKRNCSNKMEPKSLMPKKSRLEARSSCPPFKVRKEKLGDRIAALQQLVAPFGKTDTASVIMEAIGYIKFLQSQVETLSVPYMKASRNKPNRGTKGGPVENENEESKRDLKSRGLCLVPLSCFSYITDEGGATVWPPPHFGGAT